jgi:hypothetical protein
VGVPNRRNVHYLARYVVPQRRHVVGSIHRTSAAPQRL